MLSNKGRMPLLQHSLETVLGFYSLPLTVSYDSKEAKPLSCEAESKEK